MAETFPKNIGKYEVQGIIAKGGMGVVYRAMHPSLHRPVVIKKMTARKNTANVERFKREAQILLDLQFYYLKPLTKNENAITFFYFYFFLWLFYGICCPFSV